MFSWAIRDFESEEVIAISGGDEVLEVVKVSETIEKWAEETKMGAFLEEQLANLAR